MQLQYAFHYFACFFLFRFKDRVVIRPHPEPKKYENFELSGMIYCKECNLNWGVMGVYKTVPFPKFNIAKFVVVSPDNNQRSKYSRWKEVPFDVQPIDPKDFTDDDDDDEDFWHENDVELPAK